MNPLARGYGTVGVPIAAPSIQDAILAHGHGMHVLSVAYGPLEIENELRVEFLDRWSTLIAKTIMQKLDNPRFFPLSGKFWV